MKNLLITGGNGQLAKAFLQISPLFSDYHFIFTDRKSLDIGDPRQIERFFQENDIFACLNCAAYTAVDLAETEPQQAMAVNATAVGNLAQACQSSDSRLIHFSSDYVYHNNLNRPLREDDPTTPKGIYAKTKLEGENLAFKNNQKTTILRTSWVYGAYGHNFLNTMLRLGKERDHLRIVYDQIGAPTWTHDLAKATLQLLETEKAGTNPALNDIFNYSNEGVCSWYDFALAIFELNGMECRVEPIESLEYPTPAQRPSFSLMNKEKIKTRFGLPIPHWRESLKRCLFYSD